MPILVFAASADEFDDVSEYHPNQEAVLYLKSNGVLQGYEDGTFRPDQTINRAEFLKIVVEAIAPDASGGDCFLDVQDQWFARYVCYAKDKGIVSGYPEGHFLPDQNISFVEASKVIAQAFSLPLRESSIAEWYEPHVKALEQEKAIPVSVDYFEKSVTRGEMSEIVWRLKAKKRDKATKTLAAMKRDFPQIGSCAELEEKFQVANYSENYRWRGGVMMDSMFKFSEVQSVSEEDSEAAADYSTTNVQVTGVDEGDVMKNDGKYIYLIQDENVRIVEAYPPEDLKELGIIAFENDNFRPSALYLFNDTLAVLGYSSARLVRSGEQLGKKASDGYSGSYYSQGRTKIYVYDVSDPAVPSLLRESEFDGSMISSRRIDDRVYIVAQTYPLYWILEEGGVEDIIPKYEDSVSGVSDAMVQCGEIRFFPRYESMQFLVIASVPLSGDTEDVIEREVFMGSGKTVYASRENLYVGVQRYLYDEQVRYDVWDAPVTQASTVFYRFSLNDGGVEFKGHGAVPGTVLNQFSMDEHGDSFRVATTTGSLRGDGDNVSKNHLYILDRDNLETVRGKIEDIAPGEKIYSARFIGDRAYMVTFKKVDPFFVIDVSDPENPEILGKLKIPGYSDYLHPYDEDHIIGFGKEAVDPEEYGYEDVSFAWYQGMKIAVFDVSDVSNPIEKFKVVIGDRGTESELLRDHKALLFDREKELLAFPVNVTEIPNKEEGEYTGNEYGDIVFSGAYVYTLNMDDGFSLRGTITHVEDESIYDKQGYYWYNSSSDIRRVLYMGDYLYSVSEGMVKSSTMDKVEEVNAVSWEVPDDYYDYE